MKKVVASLAPVVGAYPGPGFGPGGAPRLAGLRRFRAVVRALGAPEAPAGARDPVRNAERKSGGVGGGLVRGGQEHQAQQNGDEQTEAEGSHRNVAVGEEVRVGSAQTRRSWRRAREKVPCSSGCVTARGGRLLGDGGLQDTSRLERWRWQAARRRRVHNELRPRFMLRLNILSPP